MIASSNVLNSFVTIIGVMLGGALGAACRYLVNLSFLALNNSYLPLATLSVNVLGSFLLSFLFFANFSNISPELKTVLGTGFIGALTTFSTFELEFLQLLFKGQVLLAYLYILGSVALGLAAALLGRYLALQLTA